MKKIDNKLVRRIYRTKDIKKIEEKLSMLGNTKMDAVTFMNNRLLSSLLVFIFVLFTSDSGYIMAPTLTLLYYYAYYYVFLQLPLKRYVKKLDHQALYFFEILTLTLESGRNLEKSLEVTISNVDSELSNEFKRVLFEIKFGKSLIEALEDLKKRMPSETINNILLNITQTDVFGNSILETMYNQIDFLREKQVLEIRGEINKIPNKVSIISVIFVVPLILMLILGPYFINFIG